MDSHKRWVSQIFDRAAPNYGKKGGSFFNYFGNRLVELATVKPNMHVLDIATGRGSVLFPAAKAVGPSGKIIGIDISQQMIEETSKEALERNAPWIEFHCMDAEILSFSNNTFDIVFCGFALFFLPSLDKALLEFKRVLKPGGTLAVSTWGEDSDLDRWINAEIDMLSPINSLIATPLWSQLELKKALEQAQFRNIKIIEETKLHTFHSADEWWESLWSHGTRAKFEQLSANQLAALHKKVLQKGEELINSDQRIVESLQVFYGLATK